MLLYLLRIYSAGNRGHRSIFSRVSETPYI